MKDFLWDLLQKLHEVICNYQNNKRTLSWTEAKRWYKITAPLMKWQAALNRNRCEWLKKKR